ncbi:hypothetical protein K503DRAFT_805292 [Rhizopogon vinicolor AM-OR11-026]|uniref:CBM1 domain-containing protein n=1 Tax=Rhizopogon vinicolor AM-OR11-026 TaxID=1314800 RepID=A0A1B7MID0_9AGAM|nr:hypothetical protein K503DRAFT_805292 [Rhizopogon vinicolor AM-OR11-026]
MRFSFLVTIAALAASMSVTAQCSGDGDLCFTDSPCCGGLYCMSYGDVCFSDSMTA